MSALNPHIQAELEDRLRFETLLAELSMRFINLPPDQVDQEIENALRCLVEALHVDRSTLGHLSEDRRDIVVTHSFTRPGFEAFPLFPSLATAAPLLVRTLLSGQPFIMPRLVDLPTEGDADRQLFRSHQILSGMVVPLMVGGRVIGAVGCSLAHGEREWPEPMVRGLRLIADVFANALARQSADRALQESEERMRLAAAAMAVPGSRPPGRPYRPVGLGYSPRRHLGLGSSAYPVRCPTGRTGQLPAIYSVFASRGPEPSRDRRARRVTPGW